MLDPETLPAPRELPKHEGLPDPFETFDGERVETEQQWRNVRRPELETLFRHYVYGHAPRNVETEVEVRDLGETANGRLREIDVTLSESGFSFRFLHVHPEEPAPVIVGLNRRGNHAVLSDERVSVTPGAREHGTDFDGSGETPAPRGSRAAAWCVDTLIENGYGLLTACCADIDPDRDEFTDGIHAALGSPGPTGHGWGSFAAWAWGLSRGLDYLESDPLATSSAVFGWSRLGKTALLAGATDERFDAVLAHQTGTGGLTLFRENEQETLGRITRAHGEWFNDTLPAFAGREERLPIDQHLLAAMVAPRPLLDTEGMRDFWINPPRALDALEAAAPVYELLGGPDSVDRRFADDGLDDVGALCQYRRETEHTMAQEYWDISCAFLDRHL